MTEVLSIPDVAGMTRADAAVAYAEAGWKVGPLWPTAEGVCTCPKGAGCGRNTGKHPLSSAGVTPNGLRDWSSHVGQVGGWWRRFPDANIGLLPGLDYFGLDVDDPEQWATHGVKLPRNGPAQLTGSGGGRRQQFYRLNGHPRDGIVFNTKLPGRGAETKGDGDGYLVVPPSVTRGAYSWVRTGPVPEVPDALYAILPRKAERPVGNPTPDACCAIPETIERDPGGHTWLLSRAAHLKAAHGLRAAERRLLLLPCLEAMQPPYEPGEGEDAINDILAYDERNPDRITPGGRIILDLTPAADDPEAETTWRTLADISDEAPGPLVLDMLEPGGPTLLYGAPGVGKGMTGAYLAVRALDLGLRPVVLDAERRPREWARRVAGLGGDRSRIVYVDPADLGPKLAGRPFWEYAEALGRIIKAAGGDLLLIDSILPACGVGEDRLRSDAQVPFLFVAAMVALGVTGAAFGHPPKGQPEGDPFGSMGWLAAFRLTWLATKAEGDGHHVRWRPKKRNERGHIPGVLLTVRYGDDGRPCEVERRDDEESTRDWLLASLAHGPDGIGSMAQIMLDEMEDAPAGEFDRIRERLGKALRRMAVEGWVEKLGTKGPNVQWSLRIRR